MKKELFTINNISKKFKDKIAINNLSLTIFEGDCIGLIGPNGAGKTTLLRIISGLILPTNGDINFEGKTVEKQKALIGYLPQYPNYYEWMTPREFLKFNCQLFQMKPYLIDARIEETLKKVGLFEEADRAIGGFSGGMRQRLGIAQAIIHKPKFVILDEPVSALDPIGRREILNLIDDIKKDSTVIFSTHILADAQEVCDRFCIIKQGTLLNDFYLSDMLTKQGSLSLVIQLIAQNTKWTDKLIKKASINNIYQSRNKVHIEINTEIENWKDEFFQSMIDYDVNFSSIELNNFSLEDYFMKLME
ncbi:ABC transporter ATP-binding protein [Streptococcus intermedius]